MNVIEAKGIRKNLSRCHYVVSAYLGNKIWIYVYFFFTYISSENKVLTERQGASQSKSQHSVWSTLCKCMTRILQMLSRLLAISPLAVTSQVATSLCHQGHLISSPYLASKRFPSHWKYQNSKFCFCCLIQARTQNLSVIELATYSSIKIQWQWQRERDRR